MEKLIFPGHIADLKYIMPAMEVYINADDWVKTEDYINAEFKILQANGVETVMKSDRTDYTKDAEIPRYFGFVERKNHGDVKSDCRVTDLGKKFYNAVNNNDQDGINESLMTALETVTFGKNNDGCPGSNTRLEVPNILIISSLILDGVSRQEYAGILYEMLNNNLTIVNALAKIKICRENKVSIQNTVRVDNKIVPFFVNVGFMVEDSNLIKNSSLVIGKFQDRILKLPIVNDIENASSIINSFGRIVTIPPLQKIFYGAPGTGKSFSIRERIAEHMYGTKDDVDKVDMEADYIFRTTFHPDYDYAQFVGCYKPTKDSNDITYEFIPQVFTNALIKAYGETQTMNASLSQQTASTHKIMSFNCKGATYTINAVSNTNITTTKDFSLKKNNILSTWNLLWETGSFVIKTGPQSGRSTQTAVCCWIHDKCPTINKDNFDEGWNSLMSTLDGEEATITAESVSQKYLVSKIDSETLHITCQGKNSKKTLQGCYDGTSKCEGIQVGIIEILKNYKEESFDKAWERLSLEVNASYGEEIEESNEEKNEEPIVGNSASLSVHPVYLVIEEINRGNCAQIFGDIFQLLDRNTNGESEYSISVDRDLREYLENNCPNAICNGKIKLPANLSIIATMNTSDQSLFPMDSAFKRRWEWEYVEIKYNTNFEIEVDTNHKYNWCDFQKAVNKIIKEKTHSEDKQMGDYFIKKDVTLDEFINKVMFYLWNDVCKENYHTEDNFFRTKDDSASTTEVEFSFGEMISDKENKINGFMIYLGVNNLIKSSVQTTP